MSGLMRSATRWANALSRMSGFELERSMPITRVRGGLVYGAGGMFAVAFEARNARPPTKRAAGNNINERMSDTVLSNRS